MNKYLSILILSFLISCNSERTVQKTLAKNITPTEIQNFELSTKNNEPYSINYFIEETEKGAYYLNIDMILYNNSHYVSPHARRDFKGKFSVTLENSKHITLDNDIIETPRSKEEIDHHPFVNGTINWVRENTSYKQKIHFINQQDFEVKGLIRFTIEPRCTLEKIEFIIKYKSGTFIIEKFMC